jgi:hypothetical protein
MAHQVQHRPLGGQQPCVGASTTSTTRPLQRAPSSTRSFTGSRRPEHLVEHQQRDVDARDHPGSRVTIEAVVVASAGTVASVVTSGP